MVDDKVVKITTAGSRLAILLPPYMVEALGWEKGNDVQLHVSERSRAISRFSFEIKHEPCNTLIIRKLSPLKV